MPQPWASNSVREQGEQLDGGHQVQLQGAGRFAGVRLAPLLVREVAVCQEGHIEWARERALHHDCVPLAIEQVEHLGLDRAGAPDPEIVSDGRQARRVPPGQHEARAPCGVAPRHLRGDRRGGAHDQHPAGAPLSSH